MEPTIEYKKISDKEYFIGKNKISILDDSVLYVEVVGEQTDRHAVLIREHYKEIYAQFPGKVHQLVNLNHSGKSSSDVRAVNKEMNNDGLTDKVAVFGMHPVAKVLAAFVMGITNTKRMKFFTNKEEAIAWLRTK